MICCICETREACIQDKLSEEYLCGYCTEKLRIDWLKNRVDVTKSNMESWLKGRLYSMEEVQW